MSSHKIKYILSLMFLNGLLIILLVSKGNLIFENNRSIAGIAMAIVMFFIVEMFVILYTERKSKTISSRQTVNLFLGIKAGKIILSLLFIVIYAVFVKVEIKRFIGVFLALYLIYLLFDTVYLLSREKNLKMKQFKNKEIEKLNNYYNK